MRRKTGLLISSLAGLCAGILGYSLVVGALPLTSSAQARSSEMPPQPHIVYLVPANIQRGALNEPTLQSHGASRAENWSDMRRVSQAKPLDALIVDADFFQSNSPSDQEWLRQQFWDGVVIVALSTSDEMIAQQLAIEAVGSQGQGNNPNHGFVMVSGLKLGSAEDLAKLDNINWLQRLFEGNDNSIEGIQNPTRMQFSRSSGTLDTELDVALLFINMRLAIEAIYDSRAEHRADIQRQGE